MRNKRNVITEEQLQRVIEVYKKNGFNEAADNIRSVKYDLDYVKIMNSFGEKP